MNMNMKTIFFLIVALALASQAFALTNDADCNYNGYKNVEDDCVCELNSAGPACEYARLDTLTLFVSNAVPGAMRWQMGYESEWRGLVSLISIAAICIVISFCTSGGGQDPTAASGACAVPGLAFLLAFVLWSVSDGIRLLTCDLEPISGIATTMCHEVYRQSALQ